MPPPDVEEYADCQKNEIRNTRSDDLVWADLSRLKADEHDVRLVDVVGLLQRDGLNVGKVPGPISTSTACQCQKQRVLSLIR